jgi:putative ABC transport system permease protein
MNSLLADLRYSLRMLSKKPVFTLVAVITLALGIGANTAIFSVINAVLLRELPVAEPDRLVRVFEANAVRGFNQGTVAPSNYLTWRAQHTVFEEIGAFIGQGFALAGNDGAAMLQGARVTANIFELLRVAPSLGRAFTNEEDRPGGERVVILSHSFWQRRFGGAQDIAGQTITLDDKPCTIIGVMPKGFDFPSNNMDLWMPAGLDAERGMDGSGGRFLQVIARLKPQSTLEQARAEMSAISRRMALANPSFNADLDANIVPLREMVVGGWRRILLVLFGAVSCVLLISCANVANLILARTTARSREIAIRVAMGASRLRIIRLLLIESLLLAGAGGLTGLLIAWWGVDALLALSPSNLLRTSGAGIDTYVIFFTLAVALLSGLVFGLAPALQFSKPALSDSLKDGGRGATAGPGRVLIRASLVVLEITLSLILLTGAGLMIRSFLHLQSVDLGYDPHNVLTLRLSLPEARYQEAQQVIGFYQQLTERLEHLPGVESVGTIHALPLSGLDSVRPFTIEGASHEPGKAPVVQYRLVSPGYFRAMKIALIRGRDFAKQDEGQAPGVVIINQALQRRHFSNEDPIGKRITIGGFDNQWGEIIGVVGDVRHGWAGSPPAPEMYWDYSQSWLARSTTLSRHRRSLSLALRTTVDPQSLIQDVSREVNALDKALPVTSVRTMEERMGGTLAGTRFNTLLLSLFAVLALSLAVVGLYGVISYVVAESTHQIGVRMALGAQAGDVLRLVIIQGMKLTLAGVAIGLLASFGLTRLMKDMLYGVQPADPLTFIAIAVLLSATALVACYIPARRATKVDPMVALRCD